MIRVEDLRSLNLFRIDGMHALIIMIMIKHFLVVHNISCPCESFIMVYRFLSDGFSLYLI